MESKIKSMHDNQVWNLVDFYTCPKTIGCKWIFNSEGKRIPTPDKETKTYIRFDGGIPKLTEDGDGESINKKARDGNSQGDACNAYN